MKRRQFLQSALAALLVPRIDLRKQIDNERLLSQFCGDSFRYKLDKPFSAPDQLAYATDANIMCRTQLIAPESSGEGRLPNVISAWELYSKPASRWCRESLPKPSELTLVMKTGHYHFGVCPECDGRRLSLGDRFPTEAELEGLHDYDVDDNTVLDPSCPMCRGNYWRGPSLVDLCGVKIQYGYARKMFCLPGVEFARSSFEDPDVLLFRANDFEGVCMGVRSDATA